VLATPDKLQPGPVLVESSDLDVHKAELKNVTPNGGVDDVASVATGPSGATRPTRLITGYLLVITLVIPVDGRHP